MRTLLLLALSLAMAEESTLRRAAEETRRPRPESSRPRQEPPRHAPPPQAQRGETLHASASDADDDDLGDILFGLLLYSGYALFGSGDGHPRGSYLPARFPYADRHPGWLVWQPGFAGDEPPPAREALHAAATPSRAWSVRLGADAALIDDDVRRAGGEARLHAPFRFGLDLRADWYRESLADGDADLGMVDADVTWRLVQFRNASLAIGGGGRWLRDGIGTESGGAFTLDAEVHPLRPVVVGASLGNGRLGTASLFEWRVEAGAILDRYEAVIGWERTDLGRVALDGPYLALRVWL